MTFEETGAAEKACTYMDQAEVKLLREYTYAGTAYTYTTYIGEEAGAAEKACTHMDQAEVCPFLGR